MAAKTWTDLGQITVHAFNGAWRTFPSLEAAVLCVGQDRIEDLSDRVLGHLSLSTRLTRPDYVHAWGYAVSSGTYGAFGESLVFHDHLGMRIPSWKVRETYYGIPYDIRSPSWRRLVHFDFRNGPVPGTRKRRHRYVFDRRPRTTAELREANGYLQDLADLDIRPKGRVRTSLPTVYDDIPRGRGWGTKSWKEFRKTQYKAWR